jgi:hypothetical protein
MRLIMDADCLIKLTNAGGKEPVCRAFSVVIPVGVRREVVEAGGDRPDAVTVERNIQAGLLAVAVAGEKRGGKGEDWALTLYSAGGFDGICSDDRRFLAKLRTLGIPYLTPTALIVVLAKKGCLSRDEALARLAALAPLVSADEYTVARLTLGLVTEGSARP